MKKRAGAGNTEQTNNVHDLLQALGKIGHAMRALRHEKRMGRQAMGGAMDLRSDACGYQRQQRKSSDDKPCRIPGSERNKESEQGKILERAVDIGPYRISGISETKNPSKEIFWKDSRAGSSMTANSARMADGRLRAREPSSCLKNLRTTARLKSAIISCPEACCFVSSMAEPLSRSSHSLSLQEQRSIKELDDLSIWLVSRGRRCMFTAASKTSSRSRADGDGKLEPQGLR